MIRFKKVQNRFLGEIFKKKSRHIITKLITFQPNLFLEHVNLKNIHHTISKMSLNEKQFISNKNFDRKPVINWLLYYIIPKKTQTDSKESNRFF